MQLVAYGAQDVYLTGNPQITFWKVTYRRHTNFAMESIEQTFNGQADFGRRVTCTISRNGDLAYRTYLQVTLPEIDQDLADNVYARWLDFPGEQLVSQVEVEIGGQKIDKHYSDWLEMPVEKFEIIHNGVDFDCDCGVRKAHAVRRGGCRVGSGHSGFGASVTGTSQADPKSIRQRH